MVSKKRLWIALAIAPVLMAYLAVPAVSQAAAKAKHVKCEVTKDGKTETKQAKNADDCTKMGGKVVEQKAKK